MKSAQKHTTKKIKENSGPECIGRVTFTSYLLDSARAFEIDKILQDAQNVSKKYYDQLIAELASICKSRVVAVDNLVVQTGRNVLAGILNGETTYTGIINYGALGTSSTAVSDGQTQLVAEVKRKAVGTRTRVNDQVNFDFYYSKSDTNGTYQEFGMFIDGTSTANTGQMFNRLLTGGWTKSSSESLTASVQININHA